jgi:ribosomal protein S18 acetylase RimI-like enzyme
MSDPAPTIHALDAGEAAARLPELADVLVDCVAGGASVSFMADMSRMEAEDFWRGVVEGVTAGDRVLLVAEREGRIVGTVQCCFVDKPNQPHRAEIAKMLVSRAARRMGLGEKLMRAAEDVARNAGKTLLVLDTDTKGPAYRLYHRLGWTEVGTIPNFALMPDGSPCDTTFFYKVLG